MVLSETVDAFLISCQADGLSDKTVKWYRSILGGFVAYHAMESRSGCPIELTALTVDDLRHYIVGLRDRLAYTGAPQKPASKNKMSLSSVDSHVTALHAFWAWCAREYGIANPMLNIRHPKRRNQEVKAISPADFVKMFKATADTPIGFRDRALLAFLVDSGARLAGVVGLTWQALDLEHNQAVVLEKGGYFRTVVFTRMTAQFLTAWRALARGQDGHVFTSTVAPYEGLKPQGFEQIFRRLKRRAHVEGRVNPHSFRHAFAREYLRNGGDLVSLARLLGHKDVNTTAAAYAIFSQDELAELHEKYSPLKGMMK